MGDQIERGLADCGEGVAFDEHSPAENVALASYAVLRSCDLIRAGDWRVPHRIARVAAEMNGERT